MDVLVMSPGGGAPAGAKYLVAEAHAGLSAEVVYAVPSALTSTITLGTPSGTTQTVTVQLKDGAGANISGVRRVPYLYATTSATGAAIDGGWEDEPPSVSVTTGTAPNVDGGSSFGGELEALTDASGAFAMTLNNAGGGGTFTSRFALALPDGVVVSAACNIPNA